jgi:dUTP pyrophosphatase
MTINYKKLDPRAVTPVRATKGSAGYDLTCTRITTEINECGQLVLVYHTDLALEIPEGYEGQLRPRSSISKKSLRMCNAPGTIDSDYRGEVTAKFVSTTDVIPAVYKEGERFCQLVIKKVEDADFVESEELSATERGEGGYGSTGENTFSAASGSQSSPENEGEPTNSETATEPAAESIIDSEQAQ